MNRPTATHRAIVVGTKFGARIHARALRLAGIEIVALVGREAQRTERVARNAHIPNAHVSLDDALAHDAEIVVIATPPATHYDLARLALESGRNVMCEKPFTIDTPQAAELQRLAHDRGLVGLIAHEFRFAECAALMEHILASATIGQPRLATIVAHGPLVADPAREMPDWWFDTTRGGGWLGASGSHAVDRVIQWFGPITTVSAVTVVTSDRPASSADDSFLVRFTTASGVEGTLSSSAASWGDPVSHCRVLGTDGSAWIDDQSGMGTVESMVGPVYVGDRSGTRTVELPADLRLSAPPELDQRFHRNVLPFARLYQTMAAMIEGIRTSDGEPSVRTTPATFADGVMSMRAIDAIRRSSASGGRTFEVETSRPTT